MESFRERVAAIQDSSVGQRSSRAYIYFDRKFGLDDQPMGLLCCSIVMEITSTFDRVASQGPNGTTLFHFIVHEHRPTGWRLHLGIFIATRGAHPAIEGFEGVEERLRLLFHEPHFIELFESIPVQLSRTVSNPYRSLLRCDVSLGLGH